MPRASALVMRWAVFVHRWLGVALCLLFLLWFPSGIGMMYWGMPAVSAGDRLARWPVLDPAQIKLSPQEAADRIDESPAPAQVRLNTFDGRPAYRFGNRVVYADTGEEQEVATLNMRNRAAAAWTGQPVAAAVVESVTEPDQWTVGTRLMNLRPLWKYSWPNGEQLYIGDSGEVLQYTTRGSRLAAYVSAIPHWLYFTPIRKHQPFWIRFATYTAMIGTVGAIVGVVLGVWLYSPARKYRFAGAPSRVPYRGQKRWHTILGLIFGVATVTWTFSGSLAFLPFPSPQRAPQNASQVQVGQPGPGGRGRGNPGLAASLRGRAELDDFSAHPRDLLARHADLHIKELALTSFAGQPLYAARLGDGTTRLLTADGQVLDELDRSKIAGIVKASAPDPESVEISVIEQYDAYYLDRRREQPLPVIRVLLHDADNTRHYIDPKTATVVRTYSQRNAARRWLYNGLHSLNFPWLYNHRPLWDIVVIAFMLGGTTLICTSLVLAWRVIGRSISASGAAAPSRLRSGLTS